MGAKLTEMAKNDASICAITAAMCDGTGLESFRDTYKERFFDVGIAEEHAMTFASGLAANGMKPYFAVYSSFLQRSYDNIIHDVALQKLPVKICIDRAGLSDGDGATHHGAFDVAFLSQIPNLTLYSPITISALNSAMNEAFQRKNGPSAIRYPNGVEDPRVVSEFYPNGGFDSVSVRSNYESADDLDAVIVTHGRIVREALAASDRLREEGRRIGILLLEKLTPYRDVAAELADRLPKQAGVVLFLEEEIAAGGMGMMLSEAMREASVMQNKRVIRMALEDPFCTPRAGQNILEGAGLDRESIASRLREALD